MTREEKNSIIEELVGTLSQYNSFYITDIDTLNSEHTSKLRRLCFNKQVQLRVAKNSLIKKALERIEGDFQPVDPYTQGFVGHHGLRRRQYARQTDPRLPS